MIRRCREITKFILIAAAWLCFIIAFAAAVADCAKTLAFSRFTFTSLRASLIWLNCAYADGSLLTRIFCALPVWLIFFFSALLLYAAAAGELAPSSLRRRCRRARRSSVRAMRRVRAWRHQRNCAPE